MKVKRSRAGSASITALLLASGFGLTLVAAQRFLPDKALVTGGANPVATADAEEVREVLDRYCVNCHNERRLTGGLALDVLDVANPGAASEIWEKAVRKLRTGTMPPGDVRRP